MPIRTEALIAKFQQAINEKWGYIWGTAGVMWTKARQTALEKTTDENRKLSRQYGSKWIGHMVSDCSGLFVWAFKQFGLSMSHISSNIYKSYCTSNKGALTAALKANLRPGTAVFTGKKAGDHPHVGFYAGNGIVIEAMGAKNGVVTSKLTDKKWTFYGELKNVEYQSISDDQGFPSTVIWRSTIRCGSKGQEVIECQTMLSNLGYNLGSYGVDGDFGRATEAAVKSFQKDHGLVVDGVVGVMTWTALDKAINQLYAQPIEKSYTICIQHLDKTQADALLNNYPGAICTEE